VFPYLLNIWLSLVVVAVPQKLVAVVALAVTGLLFLVNHRVVAHPQNQQFLLPIQPPTQ
jgi:hypothetical protein